MAVRRSAAQGQRGSSGVRACDGSGTSDLCIASYRHEHCACGQPMIVGALMCGDCQAEGFDPETGRRKHYQIATRGDGLAVLVYKATH